MTYSAELDCADLLALIRQPKAPLVTSSLEHQRTPWDVAFLLIILMLSALVPMSAGLSSLLTRRTFNLIDLTSSCNHKCATSMCFIFANALSVWNVFCCFCVNDQHWLHCKTQVAHHALDALRFSRSECSCIQLCFCTASGDALSVSCVRFSKRCRPTSATPALEVFLVSLSPAQSNPEKTITSELTFPNSKTWIHYLSPIKYRTSRFNLEKLCCEGSDILWRNSFTANVVCSVLPEEQASGHVRSVLADLFFVHLHWILAFHIVDYWGLHGVPIFSSPRLSTRTSTCREIVLVQNPCLFPTYSPIQLLYTLCRTCPDDARFP